jgi:hypothetical protein
MARYATPTANYDGTPYLPTVTVHVERFHLDGRDLKHVVVDVRWATREQVADILAGTVDNRAGYGTVEAAQTVARSCADLLKSGVTATYNLASWSDSTSGVTLSWQQYDDTRYCSDFRVESSGSGSIGAWEVRVGLVRWLEKVAGGDMRDPRTLLTALRRKKAVALLPWKDRLRLHGDALHGGGWVAADWDDVLASLPVNAASATAAA